MIECVEKEKKWTLQLWSVARVDDSDQLHFKEETSFEKYFFGPFFDALIMIN